MTAAPTSDPHSPSVSPVFGSRLPAVSAQANCADLRLSPDRGSLPPPCRWRARLAAGEQATRVGCWTGQDRRHADIVTCAWIGSSVSSPTRNRLGWLSRTVSIFGAPACAPAGHAARPARQEPSCGERFAHRCVRVACAYGRKPRSPRHGTAGRRQGAGSYPLCTRGLRLWGLKHPPFLRPACEVAVRTTRALESLRACDNWRANGCE